MSPPWVQFDSAATAGGCDSGSDPDIAGIGVVISFVLASIMTTTASILAMLLDRAFDTKGRFSPRAPLRYFRERCIETDWKKDYAWRPFLDPLIIGLGDQQLVTGYAVLLSGWIKVAQGSFAVQGAHFVLILYICALSSSSHLAALITLRKYFRRYRLIAKIRMTLVIVFALFLLSSFIAAIAMPVAYNDRGVGERQTRVQRLSFLVPMWFITFGFSTALVCILYKPERTVLPKRGLQCPVVYYHNREKAKMVAHPRRIVHIPARVVLGIVGNLFLNPLIAFTVQILLAILSVVLVLSQKFAKPIDGDKWCGLQEASENSWGFGQTLSVVMLLLPAMSAAQTYLEGRQDINEGRLSW